MRNDTPAPFGSRGDCPADPFLLVQQQIRGMFDKAIDRVLDGSAEAASPALRAQAIRFDEDGTIHMMMFRDGKPAVESVETIRAMNEAAKGTGCRYIPGIEVVRAVNSHDALVAALRGFLAWGDCKESRPTWEEAEADARAALAAATPNHQERD